ncbi:SGS1 [Candida margitis]|uniref:SGS1 n=1 Tax=Candida margitis TaxID=1775924 RepID=UPI00222805DA|nr:SGS1 [Candida margitis]KAI5952960.1 SGS1 [Candida margitis]
MIKTNNLKEQLEWLHQSKPNLPCPQVITAALKKYPKTSHASLPTRSSQQQQQQQQQQISPSTDRSNPLREDVTVRGNLVITTISPDPSNKENVPPPASQNNDFNDSLFTSSFNASSASIISQSLTQSKGANKSRKTQSKLPLVSKFFKSQSNSSTQATHARSRSQSSPDDVIDLTLDNESPQKRSAEEGDKDGEGDGRLFAANKRAKLDKTQRYIELIHLQETKIKLLEEKFVTSESTSISLDQKKEHYVELQAKIVSLDESIAKLKEEEEEVDAPVAVSAAPQPPPPPTPQQEVTEDIEDSTSEAHVFRAPARPRRIAEAREIVSNIDVDIDNSVLDIEDDFGNNTMEGLRTPTQERDDVDDLGSFIDDASVTNSPDGSVDMYSDDGSDAVVIESQELNNIRLSPDVAEKYGIAYDDRPLPASPINENNGDLDWSNEENDYVEDIEFSTQLNQEREIDVIEIDSDSDEDIDLADNTALSEMPLPGRNLISSSNSSTGSSSASNINAISAAVIATQNGPPLLNIDSEDDFSDEDEEIMQIINAPKPVTRSVPEGSEEFIDEVYDTLNKVFKLQSFRPNQLEAVVASLLNKDVFVLMPTGGGKSLCYQLPALIKGGHSKGTTVVISPLISLMQDQVQHLIHKNIKAGMISSKANSDDNKHTLNLFREGFLDIVYLSPEKANKSTMIQKIIGRLYERQQLARVVIDEAHCLSSWGHDFRPDYKGMSFFKERFPAVPLMALTATANEKVRMDIVHHLKMDAPVYLKQSFNRTNLFYEIKWKSGNYLESMKDYILSRYKNKCGIIYCHSKQSCEQTSAKLNSFGLKTSFYHAGMTPEDRFKIQTNWQKNKIQLICATIAFGMGIDKPDVRFVIHLFIPRSLEGYYQETGRAGRDGKPSECIMYYCYKDARSLQNMIHRDADLSDEGKENHLAKLRQVVQYCENTTDCRRKQVLHYFNESFNPVNCKKQCDNCKNYNHVTVVEKDCTQYAQDIIKLVKSIQNEKVTVLHCQDVFKGLKYNKITKMGHNNNPYHGKGKNLDKTDVERIFFYLLSEECLVEYQVMKGGFASNYVKVGRKATKVLNGNKAIKIQFSSS